MVVNTPSRFLLTLVKRLAHLVPFVSRGKVTGKGHVEYRVQVPYLGVKGREARRVDFLLLVQGRLLAVLGAAADLAVAQIGKYLVSDFPALLVKVG